MIRTTRRVLSIIAVTVMVLASAVISGATAQGGGFPLSANTAFCEPGYAGPFVGCTPWEGVTVSYASEDGTFSTACTTVDAGSTASCSVEVPFGSTITASIDPAAIPAGYVLEGPASLTFDIPDGSPKGQFGGPSIVLLPAAPATPRAAPELPPPPVEGSIPLLVDAAFCEPGYGGPFVGCSPWEGVTVSFESTDAPISTTCVTASSGGPTATCQLPVPYGSTIQVSIDPAVIPAGYVLEGSATQSITMPAGPPDGPYQGAAFVLLPAQAPATEPPAIEPETQRVSAFAAICDAGFTHPFAGCAPWDGLVVSIVSDDGEVNAACVTSSDPEGQVAGCTVDVPVGSVVTASIDPAAVLEGHAMQGPVTVTFAVPDAPVEGLVLGPAFVAQPVAEAG